MVCTPTGKSTPARAPSSAMIVARPVTPPAARPLGTMKASMPSAAMAHPATTSGKSRINCDEMILLTSSRTPLARAMATLPLTRMHLRDAPTLCCARARPLSCSMSRVRAPDHVAYASVPSPAGAPSAFPVAQRWYPTTKASRSPSSRTASTLLVSTPVRRSFTIW